MSREDDYHGCVCFGCVCFVCGVGLLFYLLTVLTGGNEALSRSPNTVISTLNITMSSIFDHEIVVVVDVVNTPHRDEVQIDKRGGEINRSVCVYQGCANIVVKLR